MDTAVYAPGSEFGAKAGYDDAAFHGLPLANVRPAGYFDPAEFETVPNVPCFAEHETVARNGRQLRFGRAELSAIVERCNRRINETGDYAALTIGHTPSPEDKAAGAPEPELVGYAGPFRLGVLGNPGERQRYAILADCHYYKADLDKVRKHPRRSPELWMEDRYEEMFFDPIALLGAEAPRLDMGLLYSARRHGRVIEKYAAACPSGGNTFVPSDDIRKDYSAGDPQGGSMISPEDVKAIVDAVEQLPAMQWAKSQMGSAGASPGAPPAPAHPPAAPPAAGPPGAIPPAPGGAPPMGAAPPPAAPHPPAPPAAPAAPPMAAAPHPAPQAAPAPHPAPASPAPAAPAAHPPAAGPGPGSPPPAAPKPAGPSGPPSPSANGSAKPAGDAKPEPKDDEEKKKMAAQYAAGNGEGANADSDYNAADDLEGDETRDHVIGDAKAKYAACDDMFDDEDEFEKYAAYRKSRYSAASGSADADSGDPKPAAGDVEGRDGQPPKGSNADGSGEAATSYGGTGANIAEKYSRLASTVEKYGKELADTRAELETERAARINAERLTRLVDLRMNDGVMIDPHKLIEKLCYAKVKSDADFKERIEFLLENGSNRMPIGRDLYVPDSEPMPSGTARENYSKTGIHRESYSKEHSERAFKICEAERLAGKEVDYTAVLDDVRAGKR